jgi:prepilin-type N-terminal cleavage/methylation domain-containing protein
MKRKGFTLVELLVVIAIIALLMGILMPALGMVRKMAQRAVCGANLAGLHKALLTYAQSNNGDYPLAGGRNSVWGPTAAWDAASEINAFGETATNGVYQNGTATIGASLYQLIKHVDVGTKSFICKGDKTAKSFALSDFTNPKTGVPYYANRIKQLSDAWDFGCGPSLTTPVTAATGGMLVAQYYSYAYQTPYIPKVQQQGLGIRLVDVLSTQSDPRLAVLADRSPYLVLSPDSTRPAYQFNARIPKPNAATERWGNSTNHDNDGQNVLFNDGSVSFNTVPYCGIDSDNIYTIAPTTPTATIRGEAGSLWSPMTFNTTNMKLSSGDDSLLINEGQGQGSVGSNL